jgi:hypothetical protein
MSSYIFFSQLLATGGRWLPGVDLAASESQETNLNLFASNIKEKKRFLFTTIIMNWCRQIKLDVR